MNSYEWILYAGIAVWSGLGLYLALLAHKQAGLSRRIKQLARLMEDER
ncbi:MAG: CcmD family protein [Desulfovibrio sp.]|jgi:CcmD family protein|nr:CcmD family protein [Desulfovibrio sp.]